MKNTGVLLFLLLLISSCIFTKKKVDPAASTTVEEASVDSIIQNLMYNIIPVDSFVRIEDQVKKNEYLSTILSRNGVSNQMIDKIAKGYSDVFNPKSLRVGNPYSLFFYKDDSTHLLHYFVYEKTSSEYVVFNFSDSLQVYTGEKPIDTVQYMVSGAVSSSLWNALADLKVNPLLSVGLSDIYAWTIDFFGIAKGDQFKIIYNETFVDSTSTGKFDIVAAEFTTLGTIYYAIPFEQDSVLSFYDETGASLRKAFLKAPLSYSRISSTFSNNRYHPVLKISRPHHGVDYAAPAGTPVHSIGDGTVTKKGYQPLGGGNYLKIKHNAVYETTYMHLKGFVKGIHVGQRVKQGELIGYVGMTGLATGPHLDFRVFKNGVAINPLTMEAPPVEPIKPENKAAFDKIKDAYIQQLDSIPTKTLEQMPSYVSQ